MALIGSDFVSSVTIHSYYCSECGHWIRSGEPCMVSLKDGKVKKRLCMRESCREQFDARVWESFACRNAKKRRTQ